MRSSNYRNPDSPFHIIFRNVYRYILCFCRFYGVGELEGAFVEAPTDDGGFGIEFDQFSDVLDPVDAAGGDDGDIDRLDEELPEYVPFLQGSRYSLEKLTASFSGLILETTREDMLLGLIRGNAIYHGQHIEEVSRLVKLGNKVMTSGGASKIKHFLEAKKRWTGDFEYLFQDQSSLLGAAMLGQFYLTGK